MAFPLPRVYPLKLFNQPTIECTSLGKWANPPSGIQIPDLSGFLMPFENGIFWRPFCLKTSGIRIPLYLLFTGGQVLERIQSIGGLVIKRNTQKDKQGFQLKLTASQRFHYIFVLQFLAFNHKYICSQVENLNNWALPIFIHRHDFPKCVFRL